MPIPPKVAKLVEQFDRNKDEYRAPTFNEANLRIQFINPMFKALGWDMENEEGSAEAYKDVVHEASLKIGDESKAPDYCFRIGGTPKFYLEAKKPFVNIKEDPEPAYQLRRYAWNPPQMPLSILTDFEEFAVYDGRVMPNQHDKASVARVNYFRYSDYAEKWDEIESVFSRDAIRKGSFDKYADSNKKKRGTATVDSAFLEEIESWRELLAKNFALRNPKLTSRELNYAVQITIDRIIFLRMCEDRGIEPYGQLRDLTDVKDIYGSMFALFRQADDRYNSGLFHFGKEKDRPEGHDELTPKLKLDDKVIKPLLRGLYYPESPYVFSKIPPEILGQVYEQFLGKVIRLTGGHQAKVEEKPEVKKAGGVYYTPAYIVDYIVKHTLGRLLGDPAVEPETSANAKLPHREMGAEPEGSAKATPGPAAPPSLTLQAPRPAGLTPKQAAKLRILDPACGSGSFLLGAFQYLLDWHLAYYRAHEPEKWDKELFKDVHGEWHLTTQEKKRILKNSIFGVDIDAQAVEVTKLSLLLKVLEGETKETINSQRRLFHGERVLPDLASNIKCGNSLIGPDFYDEPTQGDLFEDEEERLRINVFDWNAAFPAIMKAGGFDAVIGNPPYVRQEGVSGIKEYSSRRFGAYHGLADLYVYFIEKGIELLRSGGTLGFICSGKFTQAGYGLPLRRFLERYRISQIVDYGDTQIFRGATTYPIIIFVDRSIASPTDEVRYGKSKKGAGFHPDDILEFGFSISRQSLGQSPWMFISTSASSAMRKLEQSASKLSDLVGPAQLGIKTSLNEAFVIDSATAKRLTREHASSEGVDQALWSRAGRFQMGDFWKRYLPALHARVYHNSELPLSLATLA